MLDKLSAPFPADKISWRVGSVSKDKSKAMALAYVDARDVMRRLDSVFGPDWQCRYVAMPNGTTCCEIGLPVGPSNEMRWRSNGAGATDVEGDKGAYSDAFKRAAVLWGIGQYLYDLESPWVKINEWKQIEKDEYPRLRALLERGNKPTQTANQTRKSGDYERIERGLRAVSNIEDLRAFWADEQETIVKMPGGWQEALTAEKDRRKSELMARAA